MYGDAYTRHAFFGRPTERTLQGWTGRGSQWRGRDLTWRHQSSRDRLPLGPNRKKWSKMNQHLF